MRPCCQISKELFLHTRSITTILAFLFVLSCGCVQNTGVQDRTVPSENMIIYNDTLGSRIELPHPAKRIIPLNTAAAELLITLGSGDQIVGVSDDIKKRRDLMEKIPDVPSIGTGSTPDIEKILTLHPDLIISYASYKPKNFDSIAGSGTNIIVVDCYKLETLSDDAKTLGILTGNEDGAGRYIQFNKKYSDLIKSRLENLSLDEKPRVFGEYSDYTVIVRKSAGGQALAALHADNVYGDNSVPEWPIVISEWVINQDPDIIIKRRGINADTNATLKETYASFVNRPGYNQMSAISENRLYIYEGSLISSPRAVVGLVYLAKAFYPDQFSDVDPDLIRREYVQNFGFGDETQEWIYPPFGTLNSSAENPNGLTGTKPVSIRNDP